MKTKSVYRLMSLTVLLTCFLQINAKILTVSNHTTPEVAQYNTIKSAQDAASAGDTIYVYPSLQFYSGATITKRLTILGTGFNKVNNYADCSKITTTDTLRFAAGSDGSVLSSIIGNFRVVVEANNVVVQRCKLLKILVKNSATNTLITNCRFQYYSSGNTVIEISGTSNANVMNNVITGCYFGIYISSGSSALIMNNVIVNNYYSISSYAKSVTSINNIFSGNYWPPSYQPENTVTYNSAEVSATDRSKWFIDYANENFHFATGSPGIAAGQGGTDLGIYGGSYPYFDNGAPNLPIIYGLDIPATGSSADGISITVKAKTNK